MSTNEDSDRPYVTITADTHAGASIQAYREYLDPAYRERFDAWRGSYKNPAKKHIGGKKLKNWDNDIRFSDLEADGVAGEVVFPNTVPPFYDKAFHISAPPRPEQFELWLAGTRAHNRWLAEWCAEAPERRAGIGLIHLNDIDEAIADVRWIAEHDLRGGVLLPIPPDDMKHIEPLYSPAYDRLWAAIQDHDLVMNQHAGAGSPDYGDYPHAPAFWILDTPFYSQRGFKHLTMGGVFERFPGLKFILTESGCGWVRTVVEQMDRIWMGMKAGMIGELGYENAAVTAEPPSYYAKRNCWFGASFPTPGEIADRYFVGVDRVLWGSDYPHYEGTFPHTRQAMRISFEGVDDAEIRMMLGENAAKLYGFDLDALAPIAEKIGVRPSSLREPIGELPGDSMSPLFHAVRAERAAAG